jgi:hypothetical protein
MPNDPYVSGRCAEIERLMADAKGWAEQDERLGAHLAAYLTVLITGMVESCIEHLVMQRVGKAQDPEVSRYVSQALEQRFRNPDWSTISGLLRQFSDDYRREFAARIPPNSSGADALASIIGNKNEMSHVGSWKQQLTIGDVEGYYRRIVRVLAALEDILA